MQQALKKFAFSNVAGILTALQLPEAIHQELIAKPSDLAAFSTLLEKQQFLPAIKFLALGLPKREAVWWSYLCAEQAEGGLNCLKTQTALRAVHSWVHQPNEDNQRSAGTAGETLERYTPSSWAAIAAFWSGENIAPAGRPVVTPTAFMAGEAVFNAISLAAGMQEDSISHYKNYLKRGLHIAMGGNGRV